MPSIITYHLSSQMDLKLEMNGGILIQTDITSELRIQEIQSYGRRLHNLP